jgi:hypothetical protein
MFPASLAHPQEAYTNGTGYTSILRCSMQGSVTYKITTHQATRHHTPIHNILPNAPQLIIYQKALGTLPEDGNVTPKHVGATTYN